MHIIKISLLVLLGIVILSSIAMVRAKNPSIVLMGQTTPEAQVTFKYSGITKTIIAQNTGFFKIEIFDILPGNYQSIIYSEKEGLKSEEKPYTFILREDIITTISGIELEISGNPMPESPPCHKTGDFNFDNIVDFRDFSIFLTHWGGTHCEADLDSSGNVGIKDFSIFLSRMSASILSAVLMLFDFR